MVKISVILAVKNGDKYLDKAIKSILNQTFKDFEFIIINDGSSDGTKKIILSFDDSRIRYFENKTSIGLTKSLNLGLQVASGEYIARMDADDISMPERLECQHAFMEKNPDFGLIGAWAKTINGREEFLDDVIKPNEEAIIKYLLYYYCPFLHSVIFFRRKLLNEKVLYNEEYEYAQDYELYFRLSSLTKFSNIKRCLLKYRIHSLSRSVQIDKKNKQDKCAIAILKKNVNEIVNVSTKQATDFFRVNNKKKVSYFSFLNYVYVYYTVLKSCLKNVESRADKRKMKNIYLKYIIRYIVFRLKNIFKKHD